MPAANEISSRSPVANTSKTKLAYPQLNRRLIRKLPTHERAEHVTNAIALLLAEDIEATVRHRHLRTLIDDCHLSANDLAIIASKFRSQPQNKKTQLGSVLPPIAQRSLFNEVSQGEVSCDSHVVSILEVPTIDSSDDPNFAVATALLLSTNDQISNKNILKGIKLDGIRVASISRLTTLLETSSDICAFIVDCSFLRDLSIMQQQELFESIASYSSLSWYRVSERDLLLSRPEIEGILKRCWGRRTVAAHQLTFDNDPDIRQSELDCATRARDLVTSYARGSWTPSDIDPNQMATLMAAFAECTAQWDAVSPIELIPVSAQALSGGRTEAKVLTIGRQGWSSALVAKVGSRDTVIDEVIRFRTFIEPHMTHSQLYSYVHAGCGVLIIPLHSDSFEPSRPAPTLESLLAELWLGDLYGEQIRHATPSDLILAIKSAISHLKRLNANRNETSGFTSYGAPNSESLGILEESNITLGFTIAQRQIRSRAAELLRQYNSAAIVHGDIHLRNIVVSGHRIAHLIDFGSSGPGHPLIDLVRLEMNLYLRVFKQPASHARCVEFQTALSTGDSWAMLFDGFSDLMGPRVNQVALHGCVMARDAASEIGHLFNCDKADYLAAKLLYAWQSLTMSDMQTGLSRGVIEAISPLLEQSVQLQEPETIEILYRSELGSLKATRPPGHTEITLAPAVRQDG